jgi:hypothetical protein
VGAVVLVVTGCIGSSSAAVETTTLEPTLDGGGSMSLTFNWPTQVEVGSERELARWTVKNHSRSSVSLWAGVAVDGLPDDCRLDSVYRWDEIQPLVEAGTPPDDTRYNTKPAVDSDGTGSTAMRRDISAACAGDYELVFLAVGPALSDDVAQARVPLTIETD